MRGDALKILMYAVVAREEAPLPLVDRRREKRVNREVVCGAVMATLVVAASSYWVVRSVPQAGSSQVDTPVTPATARGDLPAVITQPAGPQIAALPAPVQEPRPAADARIVSLPMQPEVSKPSLQAKIADAEPADGPESRTAQKQDTPHGIWPVQNVEGAAGRLLRIGKFKTPDEAKRGWESVLQKYPGMQRLPTLTVAIKSLRDGQTYYRLQVGTSSPAHSEVVCDRVRGLDQSCSIIGSDEGSSTGAI